MIFKLLNHRFNIKNLWEQANKNQKEPLRKRLKMFKSKIKIKF